MNKKDKGLLDKKEYIPVLDENEVFFRVAHFLPVDTGIACLAVSR